MYYVYRDVNIHLAQGEVEMYLTQPNAHAE